MTVWNVSAADYTLAAMFFVGLWLMAWRQDLLELRLDAEIRKLKSEIELLTGKEL